MGIETTSSSVTKDHFWNEISGRYIPVQEYYHLEVWRRQSEDNKQGEGVLDDLQQKRMTSIYNEYMRQVEMTYDRMIDEEKNEERIVLPLSQYTLVWWTDHFNQL